MNKDFLERIYNSHQECTECPSAVEITEFFQRLMGTLFPKVVNHQIHSMEVLEEQFGRLKLELIKLLYSNLLNEGESAKDTVDTFFDSLPLIYNKLQRDVDAIDSGDPAAETRAEVIRAYPGFYAIAAYRMAHRLFELGVKNIPRLITEHAHSKTGIDIHPYAKIGENFCIDHGTGIVIGETAIVGNNVKIYQGVTLGALSVNKSDAKTKRHPTIGDNVVIYSGATILGGKTHIGEDSIIGGNVWITKSVDPGSKIYYQMQPNSEVFKE